MYVTPTEEEIFKVNITRATCTPISFSVILTTSQRYNPELQKRALETREQRQRDFDDFAMRLREASKSDKPSKFIREEVF
jgi:hypothetical protein